MRLSVVLVLALCSVALSQRREDNRRRQNRPNRNRVQGGGGGQGNRVPGGGGQGNQDTDTRLGLLAGEFGITPVPPNVGGVGPIIPGTVFRDPTCWCQPVNQQCTALRPENLNLVTRIINRPGTADSSSPLGPAIPNCNVDQRLCCPANPSGSLQRPPVSPHSATGGNQGFNPGQCGIRRAHGVQRAISPIADPGEYPWMAVILGPGNSYIGGGVIISDRWVLTAPHKLAQTQGLKVRLGDYDVSSAHDSPQFPSFEVPVSRLVVHPHYNKDTLANDVALLQLSQPVSFFQYSHISPACLPFPNQKFDGQRCFVSGWGKNAFQQGNFQRKLQEVDVPVVDGFRCDNLLRNTVLGSRFTLDKRSFICAGGEPNKDACHGDGGSPLVCGGNGAPFTVAGLVAWGIGCGQANVPAAYVNVASYVDFIRQYVH